MNGHGKPGNFEGKDAKDNASGRATLSGERLFVRAHFLKFLRALRRIVWFHRASNACTGFGAIEVERSLKSQSQNTEIVSLPEDFEIEEPQDDQRHQLIKAGSVEDWKQISSEKTRDYLVRSTIRLYTIWVLLGLIIFVFTGNIFLLVTLGVLALPLGRIFGYYFSRPKD